MPVLPKNKTVTILLIMAVLIVWGIVGYKVITGMGKPKEKISVSHNVPPTKESMPDNYQLHIYNRDPFLSILSDTATVEEENSPQNSLLHQPTKLTFQHPQYNGLIRNSESTIAIIKIDNKYLFLQKGQVENDVKVIQITPEEVTILFHNEKITVPLTEHKNK